MQLWLVPTEMKQSGISYELKKKSIFCSKKHKEEEFVKEFSVQKCKRTISAIMYVNG